MTHFFARFFQTIHKTHRKISFLILLTLCLSAAVSAAKENNKNADWGNLRYRIVWGEPGDKPEENPDEKTRKWETEIIKVVKEIRRQGFSAPPLEWRALDENNNSFRPVYIFSFDNFGKKYWLKKLIQTRIRHSNPLGDSLAFWIGACEADLAKSAGFETNIMLVNKDVLDANEDQFDDFMGNFTHELMHAVQQESNFRKSLGNPCKLGKWITEGTADAVAQDFGYKYKSNYKSVGLRYYSEPLYTLDGNDIRHHGKGNPAYFTSSFWRFLKSKALSPEPKAKADPGYGKDYSFLARMFNEVKMKPIADQETRELEWLSRAVGEVLKLKDTGAVYGEFITKFAAYTRWGKRTSGHVQAERVNFIPTIFESRCGGNKPVVLSENEPAKIALSFNKNAARCVFVQLKSIPAQNPATQPDQPFHIVFQANAEREADLRDFSIGSLYNKNGGVTYTRRSALGTGKDGLPVEAVWTMEVTPVNVNHYGYALFVISNASKDLSKTKERTQIFTIALPGAKATAQVNDQSGGNFSPADSKPSISGSAFNFVSLKTGSNVSASAQMSSYSAATTGLSREHAEKPACVDKKWYVFGCPQLNIKIAPVPASAANFAGTKAQSGILSELQEYVNQVNKQGGGLAAGERAREMEKSVDYLRIEMSAPLVDYGFTGAIQNAPLTVYTSSEKFEATNPETNERTATITIEEYTPEILRGRFTAQIYQPNSKSKEAAGTIDGQFLMVAPWREDKNFSALTAPTEYDFDSILSVMPLELRRSVDRDELIRKAREGRKQKETKSTGGSTAGCDCACENRKNIETGSECAAACADAFKNCPAEELTETEMEARYLAAIQKLYPPNLHEAMLESFRRFSPDVRRMMIKGAEEAVKIKKK